MIGTLVRLVLSLATVLTLMVFLARYLRQRQLGSGSGLGLGGSQRRRKAPPLEVVSRHGLSRGSSLAVVRVSGQLLLLGVTDSRVSVLRELEEVEEPAAELVPLGIGAGAGGGPGAGAGAGASAPGLLGARDLALSALETLRQRTVRRG